MLTEDQKNAIIATYISKRVRYRDLAKIHNVSREEVKTLLVTAGVFRSHGRKDFSGAANPNWIGGKIESSQGYVRVLKPDHPAADVNGYVFEHRLIMEKHLGRFLTIDEHIHHKDKNRKNNAVTNLEILSHSEHSRLHLNPELIKLMHARCPSHLRKNAPFCIRGHSFEEFGRNNPDGSRTCRLCDRLYSAKYRNKVKATKD